MTHRGSTARSEVVIASSGQTDRRYRARRSSERWFKRVLWIGIVANLALAIPDPAGTRAVDRLIGLPPATPLLWPRFSALLLMLLSLFYMPAAIDLDRFRPVAWLAVASRLAGVVFFLGFQPAEYRMLGLFDLVFFVPELILLVMVASRCERRRRRCGAWENGMTRLTSPRQRVVVADPVRARGARRAVRLQPVLP